MLHRILGGFTAALGAALVVAISVFPAGASLWISLALAILLTASSAGSAVHAFASRRASAAAAHVGTLALGVVLIVATLIWDGVSRGWLVAIAGAVVELTAFTTYPVRRAEAAVTRLPEARAA